ncbi:MAG TPA: PorV/PorQ family protein [Bacteroidota bacterium]|nr:PorV/PorQ family protein [Bacteroidota bacterium]
MKTPLRVLTAQLAAALLAMALLQAAALSQSKVATTAAQFLGISVGPKAMAMGSAYVASTSDVTSLYWNPGAFSQAQKTEFAFSNTEWLVGTKFRWFGLMYNIDGENAVGLSFTQLDYGEDEVTTVQFPNGTGEKWSASDLSIAVSYARTLTDRFSIGGSVKYVNQTIWNESASAFAFDLGLLFITGFNDMRLGMSMSNFGGDLKLDGQDLLNRVDIDPGNSGSNKTLVGSLKTDAWPMPLLFRIGVAMDVVKSDEVRVTLATDALRPGDNEESLNFGGEVGWREMVFLRGGYKSLFRVGSKVFDRQEEQEGLSFGAGLKYQAEGVATVAVDYAFTKFGLFGNLNTISLSIGL